MAKVYTFPTKKKLPKGMEDSIRQIAKDYVGTLRATVMLMELEADPPTEEEILELVADAFRDGIYEAIEEME